MHESYRIQSSLAPVPRLGSSNSTSYPRARYGNAPAATPTQCWQLLKRCHARSRITMNMAGGRVSVGQFRYASRTADFASHLRALPRVKIPLKNEQSAYWSKRRGCKTGAALPAAHGPNRTSKIIHLHGYYESPDTVVLASATISVFRAIQEASLSGPTPRHHGVTNAGTPSTSRHQPMYFDFLSKIKSR